jgi:hypothetical protein
MNKVHGKIIFIQNFPFKSYDKKLVLFFCKEWAASFPTGYKGIF